MSELLVNTETQSAEELVAEIVHGSRGNDVCITSSFQTEDMVVLHMLRQYLPDVPVIFLETGYHFPVLIEYRNRIVSEWGLNLINALPRTTLEEHEREFGLLHIVEPAKCCQIRKVEPLMRSLEPFSWWFTGLRREQSPTRASLKKMEDHRLPGGKLMKKISVLADWDWARVEEYVREHAIPRLPLYDLGYTSIGC
jgi:phosphoadenosine phosphosulfate reductase